MTPPSAGSQANQKSPGKKQLDKYTAPDGPLSQYINSAVQQLSKQRNPNSWQQIANGAVAQTLVANKEYYV